MDYARTPADLVAAYKDNEVAGDQTYKGRVIKVMGNVERVQRDVFGGTVVNFLIPGRRAFDTTVSCRLKQTQEIRAASLQSGQYVEIVAECRGLSLGAVYLEEGVIR